MKKITLLLLLVLSLGFSFVRDTTTGSKTTPNFSFTSDTNTGFYSIGADKAGITAGGVNVATFDVNGVNVNGMEKIGDGLFSDSFSFIGGNIATINLFTVSIDIQANNASGVIVDVSYGQRVNGLGNFSGYNKYYINGANDVYTATSLLSSTTNRISANITGSTVTFTVPGQAGGAQSYIATSVLILGGAKDAGNTGTILYKRN